MYQRRRTGLEPAKPKPPVLGALGVAITADVPIPFPPAGIVCVESGLLRFAVQCKNGARRAVGDLAPWGLDQDYGIFRDTDYVYWAIKIDNLGAHVARMDPGNAGCHRYWLAQGYGIVTDRILFEAHMLAALAPAMSGGGLAEEYDLLSAAQIADVVGGGRETLQGGWNYSQNIESDYSLTAAVSVRMREHPNSIPSASYYESYAGISTLG